MDSLLVITDEPALAETLSSELAELAIMQARTKEAAAALQKEKFRLVLIDDGLVDNLSEIESQLAAAKTPVIKLTRPIRLSDLLYTIRTRLQGKTTPTAQEVEIAPGCWLVPSERLLRAQSNISLTEKEVELLQSLLQQGGKPVSRETLLKRVWGYSDDVATHTLETHIYRLRGKLRQANELFDIIFLEEGGYRLSTV